jgi:hypothetical protein
MLNIYAAKDARLKAWDAGYWTEISSGRDCMVTQSTASG